MGGICPIIRFGECSLLTSVPICTNSGLAQRYGRVDAVHLAITVLETVSTTTQLSPSSLLTVHTRTIRETPDIDIRGDDSSLAMRICVRTYRLFYLPHTEEIFWRRSSGDDLAEASRRLTAHNTRKRAWLEKFAAREPTPVAKAESPPSTAKSS